MGIFWLITWLVGDALLLAMWSTAKHGHLWEDPITLIAFLVLWSGACMAGWIKLS